MHAEMTRLESVARMSMGDYAPRKTLRPVRTRSWPYAALMLAIVTAAILIVA